MKLEAQIEALERLAVIDAELATLEEQLDQDRTTFDGKKSQLAELVAKLGVSEASVREMDRTRNDLMQELRQMSVQIDKSREKLSRVRTEREANAVQRELEELRKLFRDREVEIEKLSTFSEQAKGDIDSTRTARDALASDLGDSESDVTTQLGSAELEVKARRAARDQVVATLPQVLYRRYEMVRKRRGTAVAYTEDGTCSACNMRLPPMFFQTLTRSQELSQCPSCNRILYFRTPPAPEPGMDAQENPSGGP